MNINYIQYGNKSGKEIVLLHGWGQNIKMMDPIGKGLKDIYHITNIDLPGFGKSEEPKDGTTIFNYCDILEDLLESLKIKNPIIIGHSFGGRIAILYASKNKCEKLILFGTPYKKSNKNVSFKVRFFKFLAKIPGFRKIAEFFKNKVGSTDYKNASPLMKKVLVSAINEDLTTYLKKIEIPTLLIWGSNDLEVSVNDAYEAQNIMKNAGVVVYDGKTHYAYLEELPRTITILKKFLGDKK